MVGRYYDPTTGQFISVDPLVDLTGQPYAYVAGDPISRVDPLGLWFPSWADISAASGLLAIVTAEVPPVSAGFGLIALGAGAMAAHNDYVNHNYLGVGFDVLGIIPGLAAEFETLQAIGLRAEIRSYDALIENAIRNEDNAEVLRLLRVQGELNNELRAENAWNSINGVLSQLFASLGVLVENAEYLETSDVTARTPAPIASLVSFLRC
jgi:hypothetical protein